MVVPFLQGGNAGGEPGLLQMTNLYSWSGKGVLAKYTILARWAILANYFLCPRAKPITPSGWI